MAKDKDYMSKDNDFTNPDRNYTGLDTDFSKERNYFSEDKSYNPKKYFNKRNKSGGGSDSMLLGLIAGAAVGIVAGILMAPDKGTETRRTLSQKGRETVDNLKGKVNDLVDTVADKYMGNSGKNDQGNFGDSGLDRTRSTASHVTPGAPSTKSFT